MLKLILGRAGSGKTSQIINEIKDSVASGKKTYLLVPEQQVYISECMLAFLPPSSALCFEVVSFSRLCDAVFAKLGGVTDTHADSAARNLVMWQSLCELSSSLLEYGNVRTDASLGAMMLSVIDELRASSLTPEDCEKAAEKCENQALANKLSDIGAVFSLFQSNIETMLGESAAAAESKLSRLAELLRTHRFFEGCNVFVDSFASFTGEEHKILNAIMAQADSLTVSLTLNGKAPHSLSLEDTAKRLKRAARESDIETETITLSENLRAKHPSLAAIEEHLWNFSLTEKTRPRLPEDEGLEEYICHNEYEEIILAALKIISARENGVKYSEMAVIARDCDSRKGIIEAVFERYKIPFFYSEKTDLSSTALSRLVLSALRCVTYNFRNEDVMTLLKTGLCGIDSREGDLFEDYCLTWNINGSKFTEDVWSMNPDGYTADKPSDRGREILKAANRVRKMLIPPLVKLRQRLSQAENAVDSCRALYNYLGDIKITNNLSAIAEYELNLGHIRDAGELLRLYDYMVTALTTLCEVLKDKKLSLEDLSSAVEIMLRNTDIGSVPAVGDCVTVGSAATLRVENIKLAVVMGLCEGEFPAAFSDGGLLTESDKGIMEELGIPLTSREDRIISDELFHAYRAMTVPSEKLVLITLSSHISGGACTPSSAWNRVRFILPAVAVKEFDFSAIRSAADKEQSGEEPIAEEEMTHFTDGFVEEIDPLFVRQLFGNKLKLTKSRISTFAECPYRYWSEYILELREQAKSTVSYANSGTMIHYVLENLLKDIKNADGSLAPISDNELIERVDTLLSSYVSDISCPLPPAMMYSFSRIRDLSLVMARSVLDEFKDSKFRVLAFEQAISKDDEEKDKEKAKGELPPMMIKVNKDSDSPLVCLSGVIDRIDCYDKDGVRYLRVVDYKTGKHKFDVKKIPTGEDLQLPAYLFTAALEANKDTLGSGNTLFPSAALFLSADEEKGVISPVRSGFMLKDKEYLTAASASLDRDVLAGIYFNKKDEIMGKAALPEGDIRAIKDTLTSSISDIAKNMYSGKIKRTPSKDACGFCKMKGNCPVACKED